MSELSPQPKDAADLHRQVSSLILGSNTVSQSLKALSPEKVDFGRIVEGVRSPRDESPTHGPRPSSRLPAVSSLLGRRSKDVNDGNVEHAIVELVRYAQELERLLRQRDKEIEKMDYLNKCLILGQEKRDEMLTKSIEENRKLKELALSYERLLSSSARNGKPVATGKSNGYTKSTSILPPATTTVTAVIGGVRRSSTRVSLVGSPRLSTASLGFTLDDIRSRRGSLLRIDPNSINPLMNSQRRMNTKLIDERKAQSILQMAEVDAESMYNENPSILFFEQILRDEEVFLGRMTSMDTTALVALFDHIVSLRSDHGQLFHLVLRLKRIIKAANTLTASLALNEALEKIVEESCAVLDCDRTTVFMADEAKEELWSKVAKGSDNTIRIPINKGIVGHVATKGEPLNILNAYQDERFNKEVDLKTNYKTNTILCVPIVEDGGRIIGVIQAINKFGSGAVFTKDDEGLLTILASLAAIILRNSMNYDEQSNYYKNLRLALRTGIYLNSFFGFEKLMPAAEKKLKAIMSVELARIFILDQNGKNLHRYSEKGAKETFELEGIAGHVVRKKKMKNVRNAYNHPRYNGQIDIDTSMPIICLPVFHPSASDDLIAVLEVINAKGVLGIAISKKPKISHTDFETLDFFSKQLAQAILNNIELDRLISSVRVEGSPRKGKRNVTMLGSSNAIDEGKY